MTKEIIIDFEDEDIPYEYERFMDTFVTLAACNKKKVIISANKEIKYTKKYKLKLTLISEDKVEFSLIEKDKTEEGESV